MSALSRRTGGIGLSTVKKKHKIMSNVLVQFNAYRRQILCSFFRRAIKKYEIKCAEADTNVEHSVE